MAGKTTASQAAEPKPKAKPKPEEAKAYFYFRRFPVGLKTLGAMGTLYIGGLEWLRLHTFGVPVDIGLNGFDALSALIANIGVGVAGVALVLVMFTIVTMGLLAVFLMLRLGNLVFWWASRGFFKGIFDVSIFVLGKVRAIESPVLPKPSMLRRWAGRVYPGFNKTKESVEGSLVHANTATARWFEQAQEKVKKSGRALWWLVCPRDTPDSADEARARGTLRLLGMMGVLAIAAVICTVGYNQHFREMGKYTGDTRKIAVERQVDRSVEFKDAQFQYPPDLSVKAAGGVVRWLGALPSKAPAVIRFSTTPKARVGSLLIARSENAATHLGSAPASKENTFRTEPVFYIGDFGDWAYVAPIARFDARTLVRRSSILEFGFDDGHRPVAPEEKADVADTPTAQYKIDSVAFGNLTFEQGSGADGIGALEARLEGIQAQLDRDRVQGQLHARTQDRMAADMRALKALAETLGQQSEVQARLDQMAERVGRIRPQLEVASGQGRVVSTLMQRVIRAQDAQDATLAEVKIWREGISATAAANETAIEALQTGVGGALGDVIPELKKQAVDPLIAVLTKIEGKLPIKDNTGGPSFPDNRQFASFISDGVATRSAGLLSDLYRTRQSDVLRACIEDQKADFYVDFGEGRVSNGDSVALNKLLVQLAKQTQDSEERIDMQLVVLRGGASYTGQPDLNMRLSEDRAEWVKRKLLEGLFQPQKDDPTALDRRAQKDWKLHLIAYGLGERLPHSNGMSARAVEVHICPLGPAGAG